MSSVQNQKDAQFPDTSVRFVASWLVALAILVAVAAVLQHNSATANWLVTLEHGHVSLR